MIELLLLVLLLVNTGFLVERRFPLPWKKVIEPPLPQAALPEPDGRFTVTLSTEHGASARDTFLSAVLKEGETMEFCENGVRRGLR